MKLSKIELREYLHDQLLIADDRYDVREIQSITMGKDSNCNPYLDIIIRFSLNDDGRLYTDNICIDYKSFSNFKIRNRKKKIEKIKCSI